MLMIIIPEKCLDCEFTELPTKEKIKHCEKCRKKDLKTLEDLDPIYDVWYDRSTVDFVMDDIKKLAKEWVKELSQKRDEHWRKIEEYGFVDFPKTDSEDAFGFTVDGIRFEEHYEAYDASIVINWIEHFFDLE